MIYLAIRPVIIIAALVGYATLWLWVFAECPYATTRVDGADWCEKWTWATQGSVCVQQPWNSISNLAFLAVAIFMLMRIQPDTAYFTEEFWLAILLIYVTFASTLFHLSGGGLYPYGMMDVGAVVTILFMLYNLVIRAVYAVWRSSKRTSDRFWLSTFEAAAFFTLGLTFELQPWLRWFGWQVILTIYMTLMASFLVAVFLLLMPTLVRFPETRRSLLAWLVSAVLACVLLLWLNVNGSGGAQVHCALGDMGHGFVQALQAYGVLAIWTITRRCLHVWGVN
jgi:hypothetical protein